MVIPESSNITSWEQGWEYMQRGITKLKNIIEGRPESMLTNEEYKFLQSIVFNICIREPWPKTQDQERLFNGYLHSLEEYINSTVLPSLREKQGEFLLRELVKRWLNHKVFVMWLSRFFQYLDKHFIPRKWRVPELKQIGLSSFRELVYEELKGNVIHAIISMIDEGEQIDGSLLKDALGCFVEIGSGIMEFEKDIELHELISLHATQLLVNHHDKVGVLSFMCCLFSKVNTGLESVLEVFKQHVIAQGTALVKQAEDAATSEGADGKDEQGFFASVFELHDKYLSYVNNCFQNDSLFQKAFNEAFEVFCNKSIAGNPIAELLATFCDDILEKGRRQMISDEAIEETLEKNVMLLAYINDKDLFTEACRNKLARSLLFDRGDNADHERSFLTKLKQQFGSVLTLKMDGMLIDMTLSKENQANFEEYLHINPQANPGIGLTVTVLTTGFWPSYNFSELSLSVEMVKCVKAFTEFYEMKTKNRKLTWIHSLGSCNISGRFEKQTLELVVTTHQAAVLLLFNATDRLSCSEIMSQLNITNHDVVRLLHSLSCGKYKILNKEPITESISESDYFEFNSMFMNRSKRIKIPPPPADEKRKDIKDVDRDRKYAIDASIVRIMKSHKVLGSQQLMIECVEQLSHMFKPDVKAVKKRIECLISREFLERDNDNPNTFRYLA